jgi:hypothetical protein
MLKTNNYDIGVSIYLRILGFVWYAGAIATQKSGGSVYICTNGGVRVVCGSMPYQTKYVLPSTIPN